MLPERSLVRAGYYRLRYPKAFIGEGVRILGRLKIIGPGHVEIGARCLFWDATLHTATPEARITIGQDCMLNGPTIQANESVTIGDRCEIADARILDTDFHSMQRSPRGEVKTAPVRIGDDVWLSGRTAVLRGSVVGDRTVVGFNAVVCGTIAADQVVLPTRSVAAPKAQAALLPTEPTYFNAESDAPQPA